MARTVADMIFEWLAGGCDDHWIEDKELQVCIVFSVRRGKLCLDIVNVVAKQKGEGYFTKFLTKIERHRFLGGIYIENVLDQRFRRYFERRGYEVWPTPPGHVPCYYKELHHGIKDKENVGTGNA